MGSALAGAEVWDGWVWGVQGRATAQDRPRCGLLRATQPAAPACIPPLLPPKLARLVQACQEEYMRFDLETGSKVRGVWAGNWMAARALGQGLENRLQRAVGQQGAAALV